MPDSRHLQGEAQVAMGPPYFFGRRASKNNRLFPESRRAERQMNYRRRLGHLDVVIPCHNEEEIITDTHSRLTAVLRNLARENIIGSYSMIFVDNGSTDATLAFLLKLYRSDNHVVVVSLRNNFGFQGSLTAGLRHTKGDAVITI